CFAAEARRTKERPSTLALQRLEFPRSKEFPNHLLVQFCRIRFRAWNLCCRDPRVLLRPRVPLLWHLLELRLCHSLRGRAGFSPGLGRRCGLSSHRLICSIQLAGDFPEKTWRGLNWPARHSRLPGQMQKLATPANLRSIKFSA